MDASHERKLNLEILLVSLAVILLEINYTRVFSFKLYYYFTYLILGIAMLGLGAGGVLVTVSERLRGARPERLIPLLCMLGAVSAPLGYLVVAGVQINTNALDDGIFEIAKLVLVAFAVFVPFLMVGIVVSTIFGARPGEINRLYFADLLGAGIGCALSVPLLMLVTPPGCVVLAGGLMAVAGLRLAAAEWRRALPALGGLAVILLLLAGFSTLLPDPIPDESKTMSPQRRHLGRVVHSEWSPVFRVDLLDPSDPAGAATAERLYLIHDGMLGASMLHFDGDWSKLEHFDRDTRSSAFSVTRENPDVLIIGAAGGHEILASLHFGAASVLGVELNPITHSLLTGRFAEFSGSLVDDERVELVNFEGRTFLEGDARSYDLIWLVAPDSYAAMNAASSGAFVLSESYLYTSEMIGLALDHLAPGGVLCVQFGEIHFAGKPNRTARFLTTARDALAARGVQDFRRHVLLSTVPEFFTMATILIRNEPFSESDAARFVAHEGALDGAVVWHAAGLPVGVDPEHPVRRVIDLDDEGLRDFLERHPYRLDAVRDDAPFFWHFARFRDAFSDEWGGNKIIWNPEDSSGERVLVILLGLAAVFALVFLLLPLFAVRKTWSEVPFKRSTGLYFAALGLGFMFFEVCLIQQMTLLLGYPTYSLTVTLFSLLVFTGLGSLLSERHRLRRNPTLGLLLASIFALMVWYRFGQGFVVDAFIGAPLAVRIPIAVISIAPLGLCLGALMPIGLATVAALSPHTRQYVAWAWAVNGFFSVISSILATMLSMTFGFQTVLSIGAGVYAIGILALMRVPEASRGT